MNLNIYHTEKQETFLLQVEPSTTVDVLKLKISAMQNLNYNNIKVFYNGKQLEDLNVTMEKLGIRDDDLITLKCKLPHTQPKQSNFTFDPLAEAKQMISTCLNNPDQLNTLLEQDEPLATVIMTEDPNQRRQQQSQLYNSQQMMMNPEYQKKIEEMINNQRLDQLQSETYENYPELFVPTEMLFIAGKINHVDIDIFVDTGAQTTIISQDFAEKANLMKLVDTRYSTTVMGVGTQQSVGRIWFFVLSATVLKNFSNDMLLGLDMMKRHHCVIDLSKHVLVFGLEGVYTKFFNEQEVLAMKMKSQDKNIEKIKEVLQIDNQKAMYLLQKYGYNAEQVIAIELKKRKRKQVIQQNYSFIKFEFFIIKMEHRNGSQDRNGNRSYSSKSSRSPSRSRDSRGSRDNRRSRNSSRSREDRRNKKGFTTIYVRGLNPNIEDRYFEEYFAETGEIEVVKIPRDPDTLKSRGFGFVTYKHPEGANKALEKFNNTNFDGEQIVVQISNRDQPRPSTPGKYMGQSRGRGMRRGFRDRPRYEGRRDFSEGRNDRPRYDYGGRDGNRGRGRFRDDFRGRRPYRDDGENGERRSYRGRSDNYQQQQISKISNFFFSNFFFSL